MSELAIPNAKTFFNEKICTEIIAHLQNMFSSH